MNANLLAVLVSAMPPPTPTLAIRCRRLAQRARRLGASLSDVGLFLCFVPVFLIGWTVLLIADARQRQRDREGGDGE